jgi:hypothetical protein
VLRSLGHVPLLAVLGSAGAVGLALAGRLFSRRDQHCRASLLRILLALAEFWLVVMVTRDPDGRERWSTFRTELIQRYTRCLLDDAGPVQRPGSSWHSSRMPVKRRSR